MIGRVRRRDSLKSVPNVVSCVLLLSSMAVSAFGQASAVRSGSFEVGGFVGASYGIDKFRVMGGGNVTYALKNKYVLPYFEYSYFPGLPRTEPISGLANSTYTFSLPLSDIHGGVHIRLPIFKESPIVPYLVFGIGTMHFPTTSATASFVGAGGTQVSVPVNIPGESDFTVNGGGGLRYYLGGSGRYGFRAEAKIYRPTSGAFSNATIGKVEAGFFFQLH
ncbi:MAG TPA: hypothetical protein VN841_00955 [Bryobacteraceae bacterium]|nr:hypothetical protein [Bryobacteraceae bacterium]